MTTPLAADMTLRDYFAAQVLAGAVVRNPINYGHAVEAYRIADMMLRARAETQRPRIHEEDEEQ